MATSNDSIETAPVLRTPRDRRRFKTRFIGIHGARSTGKTCYLACCLYGESVTGESGGDEDAGDAAASIIVSDAPSLRSLQDAWAKLTQGHLPQANAVTVPDEIGFSLLAEKRRWQVETKDYAGALVQLSEAGVPELREEVSEWLVDSDAILVLVNADLEANNLAARERMSEVEAILDRLLANSPDGNTVAKPLAVLLTKWDVQGAISEDPAHEEERALAYLESHSVFRQLVTKIKTAGDRVKVFPVSAFGSHRDENLPPNGGPRPFNLHAPLVWCAQKADEMLYESAKREAASWVGPERRWKRYSRAIACYEGLIKKAGINKGPVYEQTRAALRPLKKARFKRRCWQVPLAVIAVGTLLLGGMWWSDDHRYFRVAQTLDDPSCPISQVDAICQPYVDGWNPLTDWTGNRQEIRERWAQRKEEDRKAHASAEAKAFQSLADFRHTHPDDKDAGLRANQCRQFLDRKEGYPRSTHQDEVLAWLSEDEAIAAEQPKYEEFEKAFAELSKAIAKFPPTDYDAYIDAYNDFLARFPKRNFAKRRADIEQVELRRDTVIAQKDKREWSVVLENIEGTLQPRQQGGLPDPEQYEEAVQTVRKYLERSEPPPYQKEAQEQLEKIAWRKVKDYSEKYPRNYDVIVPRVREYIGRTDVHKVYRDEATALKATKEVAWDRTEFEKVVAASRPAYDRDIVERKPQALKDAKELAETYLLDRALRMSERGSLEYRRLESFWKDLAGWIEWAEVICAQEPCDYWIKVTSLRIPQGASYWDDPEIRLTVDLDGNPASTQWLRGREIDVNRWFGPFKWYWGKKGVLLVKLEEDGVFINDDYEAELEDLTFMPGKCDGVFRVPARDGKEIEVEMECCRKVQREIVPRPLPEYPEVLSAE